MLKKGCLHNIGIQMALILSQLMERYHHPPPPHHNDQHSMSIRHQHHHRHHAEHLSVLDTFSDEDNEDFWRALMMMTTMGR